MCYYGRILRDIGNKFRSQEMGKTKTLICTSELEPLHYFIFPYIMKCVSALSKLILRFR